MAMKGVLIIPHCIECFHQGQNDGKVVLHELFRTPLNHAIQPPFSVLTMPFTIMTLSCFGNWLYHGLCWS